MPVDLLRDVILRWDRTDPGELPLLKEGGVTALLLDKDNPDFRQACLRAGLNTILRHELEFASWADIDKLKPGSRAVLTDGLWPGVSREPSYNRDEELSSASRQPWLDANTFWVGCLRALYPDRPAVLGYLPDENAGLSADRVYHYESLEMALIEARATGGNYLLALEPRFREALLKKEDKALRAWRQMGQAAGWLDQHRQYLGLPTAPQVTQLVEAGTETAELANLMYRQNVSQALASAKAPLQPDPARRKVVVAAGIHPPAPALAARILAHAQAGATLILDHPAGKAWWQAPGLKPIKKQEDRDFFAFGKGQIIAYHKAIEDPSEFAFEVIDAVTQRRRAVRLWQAGTYISLATIGAAGPVVLLFNYSGASGSAGRPGRGGWERTIWVQGFHSKVTVLRPGESPVESKPGRRSGMAEVNIPAIHRLGIAILS